MTFCDRANLSYTRRGTTSRDERFVPMTPHPLRIRSAPSPTGEGLGTNQTANSIFTRRGGYHPPVTNVLIKTTFYHRRGRRLDVPQQTV